MIKVIKWLLKIFKSLFGKKSSDNEINTESQQRSPTELGQEKPNFQSITITDKTPSIESMNKGDFIHVMYKGKSYWAMFQCPCGCNTVITLSLQNEQNPRWRLVETKDGRPTLYPSIWQNMGCFSHFWVEDGRVIWCDITGVAPSVNSSTSCNESE